MILGRVLVGSCAATALAACGGGDASGGSSTPLVATTTIWADIVSEVACGEPVTAIVPSGADPHSFEPSLRDREMLAAAEIVVVNGSGLEESLDDLLTTVAAEGVNIVEMTTHIDVLPAGDGHDDDGDEDESDEHGHGGGDPHVWQDPTRVAGALDVIASALTATGRDATAIERCLDDYRTELLALDAEITERVDRLPPEQRFLVTSHDSLAYFADRYDLTVVGTVIPSVSTLAEPSAAALADLSDAIALHEVQAIFTEQLESAAEADALAGRLGVRVVPLVTDALTPDAPTYVELLRTNTETIAEALAP